MCKKRLLKLHKKLENDPEILSQYNKIFEEQRRLGIIETVSEPGKKGETQYLAHHPVIREDKDATKLRIVFDTSVKTFGPSLNECLYKGPQYSISFQCFAMIQSPSYCTYRRYRKDFMAGQYISDQPTITRN